MADKAKPKSDRAAQAAETEQKIAKETQNELTKEELGEVVGGMSGKKKLGKKKSVL